jgi:hypothetical protein
MYTRSQERMKTSAIGGTKNTYGVPPIKAAVHFITATPILIFFWLKIAHIRKNAMTPAATYDP